MARVMPLAIRGGIFLTPTIRIDSVGLFRFTCKLCRKAQEWLVPQNKFALIRRLAVRTTIVLLALALIAIVASPQIVAMGVRMFIDIAPPVTAPPPVITVSQGPMPTGVVGLQQWARGAIDGDYRKIRSSGFLLVLPSDEVIGVTTAHSLFAGNLNRPVANVGLGSNGDAAPFADSDTYYGPPGIPVEGTNLAIDYVLLKLKDPALKDFALQPDPRGIAQLGERVTLFSGLGDGANGPLAWEGTVYTVDESGVFALMDKAPLTPDGMSGSPIISQHTGQVVGMVIAGVVWSRTRWLIGMHPIGHLVELAQTAAEFPPMVDFQR